MANIITVGEVLKNNCSLSAKLYEKFEINYKFSCKLRDFLINPIKKGKEVGSDAYIPNKKFKFIRTNCITNDSFLFDEKECVGIPESFFVNQHLKKNQILIVKDGSLGNVAFLDDNYDNYMISSGINSISCNHPYYIFSILQHDLFKQNFEYNVASGSTISHAKNIFLDFDIPLPKNKDKNTIKFIENIMESIIFKEHILKEKIDYLNKFISSLLNFNGFENIENTHPTFFDLKSIKRLDSGYYSNKSIFIRNLIESYNDGFFYIPQDNIKGGNTPKSRSEPSYDDLEYIWLTPSYINNYGFNNFILSIDFKGKNNINKDVCLVINRTSKKTDGQSGKYVGISSFYDYSFFGKGHHNQGFYRIINYKKSDLIVFVCLLNHPIYREYFGEISMGSKMKEIKKYNLIEIPFPKFNKNIKNKINELYYNNKKWNYNNFNGNFREYDKKWSINAGIYDLYLMLIKQKKFLNNVIEKIYNNENIMIDYSFNMINHHND